jgi:hypothetical protein
MLKEQSLSESIEFIKNEIINDSDESTKKYHFNYNDDNADESWADNNIFFPIANKLIEPLQKLSLTHNKVTILSTIFTFLSIYFIHKNERLYAVFVYFIGYLLDCVKNNTTSNYDMALNLVFNIFSNVALLIYLINKFGLTNKYVLIIIFSTYMLGLNYGVNEAINSKKTTSHDNFLLKKINKLKNEKDYIFTLFLYIIKLVYRLYKSFFKEYNEELIFNWLPILKNFSSGNYCLLVSIILLFIE